MAQVRGYPVTFEQIDGDVFAQVPALPGCASDGATRKEAMRGLHEAIDGWISMARKLGRHVPVPA